MAAGGRSATPAIGGPVLPLPEPVEAAQAVDLGRFGLVPGKFRIAAAPGSGEGTARPKDRAGLNLGHLVKHLS